MCVSFLPPDISSWTCPTYITGSKVLWQIFVSVALLDHEQEPFFLFEKSYRQTSFLLHFCLQIRIIKCRDWLRVFCGPLISSTDKENFLSNVNGVKNILNNTFPIQKNLQKLVELGITLCFCYDSHTLSQ